MEMKFEHNSFNKRLNSMLKVDFRRMFTMRFFYIMAGICFVMPILILVMTTMFSGEPAEAGAETMGMFTNTWQAIGSFSGGDMMSMDLTTMCNINMLYFFVAVLVGLFVADDFRSGYAKNLFTVRAKKGDYVISKTLVCFVGSTFMLIAYFIGTMIGGAIAGLPFDVGTAGADGIFMCMLAKIFITAVFVGIDLAVSTAAKQKAWLSIIGSMMASMLLYTMVPMITPLDSGIMNVILCLAGGVIFSAGIGAISKTILSKTSLV